VKTRSNLSASVIPTRRYPSRRWYYSNKDESWYYHGPRKRVVPNLSPDFDKTVDPALQPLVDYLHLRRISTTPSCEGHFSSVEEFEPIWKKISSDSEVIRTRGLPVSDVETGEKFLFKNKDYRIPWENYESFWEEAGTSQSQGYIGFYVRDTDYVRSLRHLITEPSLYNYFRESGSVDKHILFTIGVRKTNSEDQSKEWNKWLVAIQQAFLGVY